MKGIELIRDGIAFVLRIALATLFGIVGTASMCWLAHLSEAKGKSERIELYLFWSGQVGVMATFLTLVALMIWGIVSIIIWEWNFSLKNEAVQVVLAILLTAFGVTFVSWWVLTRIYDLSITL